MGRYPTARRRCTPGDCGTPSRCRSRAASAASPSSAVPVVGHLRAHVGRGRIAPVAGLEELDAAPRRRLEERLRGRRARRGQIGRDHRHLHALRGQRLDRARKILGRAFGQDVPTRPDGEVHALESALLDRAAEVAPVELWQMLGEQAEHPRRLHWCTHRTDGWRSCRNESSLTDALNQLTSREHRDSLFAIAQRTAATTANKARSSRSYEDREEASSALLREHRDLRAHRDPPVGRVDGLRCHK